MKKTDKLWVVIPASGVGSRMQADRPKQYLDLLNKSVIEHTLSCFTQREDIAGIILGLSHGDPYWPKLTIQSPIPIKVTAGGKERCNTVLNALSHLRDHLKIDDKAWVLVHDAARPCLSQGDIDALIASQKNNDVGGILAMPVRDTMKREQAGTHTISHTENREGMWHALTPQMFQLGTLYSALEKALTENAEITDEASALEYVGKHPRLVEGLSSNIKITRPADMALAEFFLEDEE